MAMEAYLSRIARNSASQQNPLRIFSTSSTSFSSLRALNSAIKSEQDPLKLFESSISIPTFRRYRPHSVHNLSGSKLIDRILTKSTTSPPAPQLDSEKSEDSWLKSVASLSECGMTNLAFGVLDRMLQQQNLTLTENSICALHSLILDNKIIDDKFDQTLEAIQKKSGVSPGVKTFNVLLKYHCKEGELDKAQELIKFMETEANVQPDISSFNILLETYQNRWQRSDFDTVLKQINERGLQPDLITYNHRILRYFNDKECVRAKKLLDEMIAKGVEPNSFSYGVIIFGFCKVGDLESARKVLEKMVSDGYVKELFFGVEEEGVVDRGLEICKRMLKSRSISNPHSIPSK